MTTDTKQIYRVLVVDDDTAIRETYRHILQPPPSEVGALEALISGPATAAPGLRSEFEVTEAEQGETAAALHQAAVERGQPYQLAFIDMRMPPGWDGMRTAVALRAQDPSIYIVIATAFSDYNVNELQVALGHDVVLLRKPFNQEEVYQLARTLCQSWETRRRLETVTSELENHILQRTGELDRRTQQQQALAEIATRFVELGEFGDIEDAAHWALARLGRITGADHAALFSLDETPHRGGMIHEWTALGVPTLSANFRNMPGSAVLPAMVRFQQGKSFHFMRLDDLAEDMSALRAALEDRLQTGLAVPVDLGGRLAGVISVGFSKAGTDFDEDVESLLRTAGHIIFRALEAHAQRQALEESKSLLEETEHVAHIGNWRLMADTLQATWDDEIHRIFGIGPEQAAGPDFLSTLVYPEDWPAVQSSLMRAISLGTSHRVEYRIRRPNGELRWVSCWAEPQRDASGRVLSLVGMLQDITERQLREERLRLLSEAVEQSPASVVITDLTGTIEYVNRRFTEVTGYSVEEVIGQNPRILKSGSTPLSVYAELWRVILAGGIWRGELQNRRKDGTLYWENAVVQGMKDDHGRVRHFLAVKEDITERRNVEQSLRGSEARYRALFDNISSGVAIFEVQGNGQEFIFKDFNKAGERIDGDRREDLLGKSIHQARPGIDAFGILDVFRRVAKTGVPERFPAKTYQDERIAKWYENFVYRLPAGEVVAVFDDVTESKQAELALQASEEKYRAMFENMAQGAFYQQADGKLVDINRAALDMFGIEREQFLGNTSHDTRWRVIREDGSEMPPEEHPSMRALATGKTIRHAIAGVYSPRRNAIVWLSIDAIPQFRPDESKPYQTFVTMEEITQRLRLEAELREAEHSREALLANLPGMAYRCLADAKWTLLYVSTGVMELTGYSREDLVGENQKIHYAEIIHPEDRDRVAREVALSLARGEPFELRYRIVRADGGIRAVWERGRPTSPPGRQPVILEGFIAYVPSL